MLFLRYKRAGGFFLLYYVHIILHVAVSLAPLYYINMLLSTINNTKRFESEGEVGGGLCNIKIWFKGEGRRRVGRRYPRGSFHFS